MHKCALDNCPIVGLVDALEKKWALRIVKEVYEGNARFNELKRRMRGVTATVLSKRLRELEDQKIISRKVVRKKPLEVEYRLDAGAKHLMECWHMHKKKG
ncbi:MAG: helix-turn-helix domain-containing protein [Candidatus Micrarchaeota archaeon]